MIREMELEEAIHIIANSVEELAEEYVDIEHAWGRVLAESISAESDQPPFHRSPLDGFAVRSEDIAKASRESPAILRVIDSVYAGQKACIPVNQGEAVKIMTGAMLPAGCDCVVRQEDTDQKFPLVSIYHPVGKYQNYCFQGEDFKTGDILLKAKTRLDAAALSVLASAGITKNLKVKHMPAVGVISTGDELVPVETSPLPEGKIYSTNERYIKCRLRELGICDVMARQAPDDAEAVANILREMLPCCDVIITTGGVSVGEKDILHEVLPLMNAERVFWRVKLKPGSPVMFSFIEGIPVLSLSGNPFAAAATFEVLARPLLSALSGTGTINTYRSVGILENGFGKMSKGRRLIRAKYEAGKVWLPESHASGMLSSFVGCNCLVDIPAGSPPLKSGQRVSVIIL